jgi:hypothetical protein
LGRDADIARHDLEKQLGAEEFTHTYIWQDGPGVHYPDHTHARVTAHIILDGGMSVMSQGKTKTYKATDWPQHFLYFLPLPQGQGSLRLGFFLPCTWAS